MAGLNDGKVTTWRVQPSNLELLSTSQAFTLSCMQIELLDNYDYYSYPFVALAGMVSKVIVFNTRSMTPVRSVRVLVQNW
jgi:hypothetical protein